MMVGGFRSSGVDELEGVSDEMARRPKAREMERERRMIFFPMRGRQRTSTSTAMMVLVYRGGDTKISPIKHCAGTRNM